MPVTADPLLDLAPGIGQVQWDIEFDIVDRSLELVDQIKPLKADGISAKTSGNIKRQLQGIVLDERQLRKINLFSNWLKPWFVLENGSRWPLGVYVFTDAARQVGSYTSTLATTMMDQDYVLDQGTRNPFGIGQGGPILPAVTALLDDARIANRDIPESSAASVGDPVNWPAGTSRLKILNELCNQAGWLPPYFDNNGTLVIRIPPDIARVAPDHRYDGRRVKRASLVENDNLLSAPNVYLVLGTGPSQGSISAVAYVDPTLPFSVQNRGFEIVSVTRAQGVQSVEQAQSMANALAAGAARGYKNIAFTGPRDPRHDLFQTVEWEGSTVYREISWDLKFRGGFHSHTLTLGGFPNAG